MMVRIGITFTKTVIDGRHHMYGVYESPFSAYGLPIQRSFYVRYEGYVEGEYLVRLTSCKAHSVYLCDLLPFDPDRFEEVLLFPKKPS